MTEEEAKTRWCPMMRDQPWIDDDGKTTNARAGDHVHCIGSGCMMWRWTDPRMVAVFNEPWDRQSSPIGFTHVANCVDGGCGLAGKP